MKSSERKPFFRLIKAILRLFIKAPKIDNRNDSLAEGAIFICNHVGSTVPLKLELYLRQPFKFWGTCEMTLSHKVRYDYLANNYFYKKKHNPKAIAHLKAFFANPFVGMFYKGMQLIPTYQDGRLLKTIKYSMNYLEANKSLVIFPENSSDGYHDVLEEYHAGFLFLAKHFHRKTKRNISIYNMYYRKKDNTLVIDKVYSIEDLLSDKRDIRDIAADFKNRANELASIPLDYPWRTFVNDSNIYQQCVTTKIVITHFFVGLTYKPYYNASQMLWSSVWIRNKSKNYSSLPHLIFL